MIKFRSSDKHRELVGLGITEDNLREMKKGYPVLVKFRDLEMDTNIEVCIFYGENEKALFKVLKDAGLIGGDTKINGEIPVATDETVN